MYDEQQAAEMKAEREAEDAYAGADDDTLGPCGCTDYHMADCNVGGAWLAPDDYEEQGDDGEGGWI